MLQIYSETAFFEQFEKYNTELLIYFLIEKLKTNCIINTFI